MEERMLRILEFDKIIDQLIAQASTSLGKDWSAKTKPLIDIEAVKEKHRETDEARTLIRLQKELPFGGIFDIRKSLKRSQMGGILTEEECLNTASTIYGGQQVKRFMENLEEDLPILQSLSERITPLKYLEQKIKGSIDDHGNVLDHASAKLRGIRLSIQSYERKIRDKLAYYTKNKGNMLSDVLITIRNNRYVLPVKQEYRGSIGGIVHDQSASGQTLFMEPKAIVDLNNQLQEAILQEEQEIERILRELSQAIAESEPYLGENITILGEMDVIFARAKLGEKMKAARPKLNNYGYIKMKQAKHPLIPSDEIVPNDVEIGGDYTTIVITGPNTGGKTVTLKMVGLCTLMAQAGLQIPAEDGCELAVFEHVLADIGDEQSIEQNLSTFSSHMTNIVKITEKVNAQSLVLFDELGAGTDPQEGAALAMSLLDEVMAKGTRVIATTHYPELKAYSYNRDHVVNASVEFDVDTLKPTYHLLIGIPGRSNAFDISKRLGLDHTIIDHARELIGIDSKNIESMIKSLEDSRAKSERDYAEAHAYLLESEQLRNELQQQWDQFEKKKEELYKKAEEKAEKALQNAREEADLIVDEMKQMRTKTDLKEHKWIEAKKMLEEAQPNLVEKPPEKQLEKTTRIASNFEPGDDVKVISLNQNGTIVEKISAKEYLVQVGIMKVNVKQSDLQLAQPPKETMERPLSTIKGSTYHVKTELDLRGERFEDALQQLEKYIDDALLAGYQKVSIIHGKGTGALRKGVHQFAENHPHIASYRLGSQGEGGSGVTILEFQ